MRTSLAPFLRREQQELTMGGAPEASTSLDRAPGRRGGPGAGLTFTQKGLNREIIAQIIVPFRPG